MMEAGLVSVVLPIYNVEKYLDRCVESVVNQSYKNLEIILVDDGSTDSCPQKCDEWARKDNRVKAIHKANAGLGYARNTGIENATGEYICFFDSDDYIAKDTIEKTYKAASMDASDMVLFGHYDVNAKGRIVETYIPDVSKKKYEGAEIQSVLLPDMISNNPTTGKNTNLWLSACFCMYSMRLILETKWRFVSERDIISEDVYSLLHLYKSVKRVTIIPEAYYYYCENSTSLTHTYQKDRFDKIKHFYVMCLDACEELGYGIEAKKRFSGPLIANTIAAMKMIVQSDEETKEKEKEIKRIINDDTIQDSAKTLLQGKEKRTRKLFLMLINKKMHHCCYLLIKMKTK